MGMRGPTPKRNEERLSKDANNRALDEAPSATAGPVPAPPLPPGLDPLAVWWYECIAASGESQFFEPSDWAQAVLIARVISDELGEQVVGIDVKSGVPIYATAPMAPAALGQVLKASGVLGITEGDRRRMGIQLTRSGAEEEREAQILHLVRDEEDQAFGG
mgnify:FL=1